MRYFVKTPWWLKKLYPDCIWDMEKDEKINMPVTKEPVGAGKVMFLTFDDGPDPVATPFVLEQLRRYNAKATFFCIGKNVDENFATYKKILDEGHVPGNHTYDHLNGWKTKDEEYLNNILKANLNIDSDLFRPPYGKISKFQLRLLKGEKYKLKTIMWSVLSGDFDKSISAEKCYSNVIKNAKEGSIVVFHDSEKCLDKLRYVLPRILEHFNQKGFEFKSIIQPVYK